MAHRRKTVKTIKVMVTSDLWMFLRTGLRLCSHPRRSAVAVVGGQDNDGFHSHKGKKGERTFILVAGAGPAAVCGQKQA